MLLCLRVTLAISTHNNALRIGGGSSSVFHTIFSKFAETGAASSQEKITEKILPMN